MDPKFVRTLEVTKKGVGRHLCYVAHLTVNGIDITSRVLGRPENPQEAGEEWAHMVTDAECVESLEAEVEYQRNMMARAVVARDKALDVLAAWRA